MHIQRIMYRTACEDPTSDRAAIVKGLLSDPSPRLRRGHYSKQARLTGTSGRSCLLQRRIIVLQDLTRVSRLLAGRLQLASTGQLLSHAIHQYT